MFPEEVKDPSLNIKNIIQFSMEGINKDDFDFDTIPKECIVTDLENE